MDEAQYTTERHVFSMACRVEVKIHASAETIWKLLTDAEGFPRWNSTITRIEGRIQDGQRLKLHVPGTSRTFKPKVSDVVQNERMTWGDGFGPLFKGVRTFVLKPEGAGSTTFVMEERFCGLIFAMVKRSLPDFGPIFEKYAADLKREAERAV